MLSNLSNNNSGNATKSVVEKKHYEDIEKRLDELQDEIEMTEEGVSTNSQAIASLDGRVAAVEDNSTFPELNTDTINPATGNKIDVTGNLDVDGAITADFANFGELSVNGTNFTTVKDNAAQAKTIAENAENKADEAYDLADAVADELADYKADNEQSITTGTLNADSVVTDSIAAQTINTNDFETTNAEIDKLYVDTIKATGFLELPTAGQSYYTITVPAKTTASFSGVYTSDNNTDYHFYFTVSDGAVIYKQNSTEIIKDISFDRETGSTKVRVKSSTNLTYISSALDSNPVTIEDGGNAYTDYVFIPQKTGGYLIRGYDDTTTEIYIAGVLRAYAMSVEEEIIERTSVDFLKVNASIELPKDWDAGGTISYSTGEENEYISAQTKVGVTKPTWTSPIHSTIGSLSYSSKLVDEATIASYKGISETRQTQTISITNEASLQQLTAFHWTKNGTYWQPYETTRITIGDHTMWIDPTESNQGIRFYNNQVIADGTWDDVPIEEANAVPVNLVIFDAPTELSFPITNLGDKTTVHGEITATCFKGNVLGNVTGNADTATNATHFDNKTYAEAKADILSGCAADSNKFNGKTYSEACADILSGNAATATNATCFGGKTYSEAKTDILSGCAANANDATCFDGHTYADAKADILSGNAASATNATNATNAEKADKIKVERDTDTKGFIRPILFSNNPAGAGDHTGYCCVLEDACCIWYSTTDHRLTVKNLCVCGDLCGCAANADNATCFDSKTYTEAKTDILSGTAAQAHCVDIDSLTANSYPLVMESTTCELGKSGTCQITFTPSTGILETNQVSTNCIENSGTVQSQCLCATCDLNVDGNAYITGDLTVQGTITTTHSEEVVTPSENIILRDGATTPIASGCYSGFTVTNYDGSNNLEVGADKDGTLHVGVVGGTMEPVATRATEACMENGYAAHWDATGTDLVTKGATNTHDLTVNGNASTTGNLSVTGNATVTGTLTADLTGTADNATCFDGCTYSQAKADILSGNAATATNATCFDGCTYAEACADILSGCASEADNATCFGGCTYSQAKTDILSGCAADSAKLGNKAASCYIDNSSTAQAKAGTLKIGAPAACTTTSAGGAGVLVGAYGALQIFQDTPTIDLRYHKYCGEYSARLGNTAKGRFHIGVNDGEGCTGCTQSAIYCFNSDGTFTGATNICGTNIYQNGCKVIDTSSTTQTKAGDLNIGAPAACTSTSAGGAGLMLTSMGCMDLYSSSTPFIDFHYNKYCGDYSTRIISSYADDDGVLRFTVNNGKGCTVCTRYANYCFRSNGIFTGASTICASTNIYSAGCPVVTTGNIATVAPGYNCTGTSNYVVSTMVCCAKQVCRNQATTGTCHLAMFDGKTAIENADAYVSNACPITYEPATGVLTACCVVAENTNPVRSKTYNAAHDAYSLIASTKVSSGVVGYTSMELVLFSMNSVGAYPVGHIFIDFSSGADSSAWNIQGFTDININSSDNIHYPRIVVSKDTENYNIYVQSNYSYERLKVEYKLSNNSTIPDTITATSSPSGTIVFDSSTDKTKIVYVKNVPSAMSVDVSTSSSNAEYPLVFSTCCATPAAGNRTLYNDSANNLMYNPSTNTLTACMVCNSLGQTLGAKNNICASSLGFTTRADYSLSCVIATLGSCYGAKPGTYTFRYENATSFNIVYDGSKEISYNATIEKFDDIDTSTGTYKKSRWQIRYANGTEYTITDTVAGTAGTHAYAINKTSKVATSICNVPSSASTTCDVTITSGCCSATAPTYYSMCLCGSNGKLYNPQGFVGSVTGNADTATNATCFGGCTYAQAKADILSGTAETSEYSNINDVNSGSQDILMTSTTGELGVVNASTGTNACPLKYNPATGELATTSVKIDELSYITGGVNSGDTMMGILSITNDGFTMCANHPTCSGSNYNWPFANVYGSRTALGKCARACCTSVAVGYEAWSAEKGGVAVGCHATALGCNSVAVGIASCAAHCAVAIGKSAFAARNGDLAIGYNAKTCEYGVGYFRILKDIRYSGFRETTFCITCNAEECQVYTVLNSLFCTNPAQNCPGYGHDEWPAYGINGCCYCFFGSIRSDRWGAGQQCCFFRMGSHTFTDGCTATVGCNMFVTVIAPVKE